MLRRILFGLLKGALVGGVLGALLVFGLGMPVMQPWLAYLAAVVTGALTGLVAGKPIWTAGARVEAGLKAAVGAVIAGLGMLALRKWLNVNLDLGALGKGGLGSLSIASLPLIATVLGLLFEADNTGEEGPPETKKRVEPDKLRLPGEAETLEESEAELEKSREATASESRRLH